MTNEPVTNEKGVMSWTGTKWEYLGGKSDE